MMLMLSCMGKIKKQTASWVSLSDVVFFGGIIGVKYDADA